MKILMVWHNFLSLYGSDICWKNLLWLDKIFWKTTFRSRQRGDDAETIVQVFCLIFNFPTLHFRLIFLKLVPQCIKSKKKIVFARLFFVVRDKFLKGQKESDSGRDLVQKLPTPESKLLVFHFSLESLKHSPNFFFYPWRQP